MPENDLKMPKKPLSGSYLNVFSKQGLTMKFDPVFLLQTSYASPLGPIILAASPRGLVGLWFAGQRHLPALLPTVGQAPANHPLLQQACQWLDGYFSGKTPALPTLDLSNGTAFQQAVWQALLAIPAGSTTSYAAISQRIGNPSAVRAVGAAIGRNPVSLMVPCHRVVASGSGALTGYAGGLERKAALLAMESTTQPQPKAVKTHSTDNRLLPSRSLGASQTELI